MADQEDEPFVEGVEGVGDQQEDALEGVGEQEEDDPFPDGDGLEDIGTVRLRYM